jgi:hypothetical protein
MSYLQRLAATAMNPVISIHPVLGSVFSAAHRVDPELSVATPAVATPAAAPPAVPTPPGANRFSVEPEPAASISPQPTRSHFEPLIESSPLQWSETPDPADVELSREVGRLSTPAISPAQKNPETTTAEFLPPESPTIVAVQTIPAPARQPETAKPASIARAPFRPLIEEQFAREGISATPTETAKLWSAGEGRKQQRKDGSRIPAPSSREPDEIRIHIGRIEVTAVPPAQVRSDPKPVKPSLNLGDYLKRRSGRS